MKAKHNLQNVSFRSVDEFLHFLPAEELKMTELLRKIIFSCIPDVSEKLSYHVPFYKRHANICFIWPTAVQWGNKRNWDGVRFGFSKGYLLQDEMRYLDRGERKQVYWKDFKNSNEIDIGLLRSYIVKAACIDEQFKKKK